MDERGGKIVAICAQPEEKVQQTKESWSLNFQVISDPYNTLAREYDVVISPRHGYAHGMGQPAILCISSERKILYRWKIIPSIQNTGGASDRPVLEDVWSIITDRLDGKEVDQKREKNIRLTSKKDWRILHKGVINLMQTFFFGGGK